MSVTDLLARGRAAHEAVLVDTCAITRATRGALNESTGAYAATTTSVYTGACRIKPAGTATVDSAGVGIEASRPLLELPWTVTGVLPGDTVAPSTGPYAGRSLAVFAEVTGTTSTVRRFTVEVLT